MFNYKPFTCYENIRLTADYIHMISTQQNNNAGKLIGSFLLNMNLGAQWRYTDVINRLV